MSALKAKIRAYLIEKLAEIVLSELTDLTPADEAVLDDMLAAAAQNP